MMRARWAALLTAALLLAGCGAPAATPAPTAAAPQPPASARPTPPVLSAVPMVEAWVQLKDGMTSLSVRREPRDAAEAVGAVLQGTKIRRARTSDAWVYVEVDTPSGRMAGYAPAALLSDAQPSAGAAASPAPSPVPARTPAPLFNDIAEGAAVSDVRLVVDKADRRLTVLSGDTPVARFSVGLGFAPVGDKEREGDGKTPEGEYTLCTRNDKSQYYLSLGVSYPSEEDAARGVAAGLITQAEADRVKANFRRGQRPPWDTALGGQIMVHGRGGSSDWTVGCIAVDDPVMDILWRITKNGTRITINP